MSLIRTSTAALLMGTALTTAAWADLTAEQVWDQMREMQTRDEASRLTFDKPVRDGDTLIVNNVAHSASTEHSVGDDEMHSEATLELGTVKLTEQNDGSVLVGFDDDLTLVFKGEEDGDDFTATISVKLDNPKTIVSEAGDAMRYDTSVDRIAVVLSELEGEDETEFQVGPEAIVTNFKSVSEITDGEFQKSNSTMSADEFSFKLEATGIEEESEDGGEAHVKLDYTANDISAKFNGVMPAAFSSADPETIFSDEVNFLATFNVGASDGAVDFTSSDGDGSLAVESSSSELAFGLDKGAVTLATSARDFNETLRATDIPFPVKISGAEAGLAVTFPLSETDTPADFSLELVYDQLSINDETWNLIDSRNAVPHTPLTLRTAISGTIDVLANLYDPEAIDTFEETGNPAINPQTIDIDQLSFEGVGVTLEGTGALKFPADAPGIENGPVPVGSLELVATGVSKLLNRLGEAGVIPADQAAMQQMMLGMFAEKLGEDTLRTVFEFKKNGEVIANGQRIR